MSTVTPTTLKEDTANIEKMYGSSSPTITNDIDASSSRQHYRGDDVKVVSLPPDINNMVNKGLFALAFFIAILSGVGVGLSMILKYKLWILLAIIFILVIILSPDISDYFIYGLGEYIDLGYTGFKNVTGKMFLKMKSKSMPTPTVKKLSDQPTA